MHSNNPDTLCLYTVAALVTMFACITVKVLVFVIAYHQHKPHYRGVKRLHKIVYVMVCVFGIIILC